MYELYFKCVAVPESISLIDNIIELTIKKIHNYDYKKICFAIHELVINSIDAMSKNNQSFKQISISLICSKKHVLFSINDFGGGLPSNILNKLHTNNLDSLGLNESGRGLAIIKMFVDNLTYNEENDGSFTYKIVAYMDNEAKE
ncbi:ATP-binding protein [Pseudobacteroides cellulosolvens]|uniref:Putative anti-sigma regulatory factor, serine/threonine protein kinase n=1 Tax=Pseudobacteroides cellulosolvens ATCC 35603 = DSM 2933 TaxID=398512 RepID=A0A0L6JSY4_9FIRM|nr:ATP-binding protein [Pseudobacteroides cellulosolvens]KNY28804.1 putative anti-sigma regulatory factor, serine/threonine protein kinase [Pseudobacteroides cellulosolvens ATCC 35603 = DSM 2933]